jgi:uncharacterized integral membrane protein
MRWIWNVLVAVLFVLVLLLSILAVSDNSEAVALRLLRWETPAISIYWWLVASLVIGMVFGWLTSLRAKVRLTLQARQLRRELEQSRRNAAREPASPAGN